MNTAKALITIQNRRGDFSMVSAIIEAIGPDAWENETNATNKLRTALITQDATLLGEALLEPASDYVIAVAESIESNPVCTAVDEALDILARHRDLNRCA